MRHFGKNMSLLRKIVIKDDVGCHIKHVFQKLEILSKIAFDPLFNGF